MGKVEFVNGITITYDDNVSPKQLKKQIEPIKKDLIKELKSDSLAYRQKYAQAIGGFMYDSKD